MVDRVSDMDNVLRRVADERGSRDRSFWSVKNVALFEDKAQLCRQYLAICYVAALALKDRD